MNMKDSRAMLRMNMGSIWRLYTGVIRVCIQEPSPSSLPEVLTLAYIGICCSVYCTPTRFVGLSQPVSEVFRPSQVQIPIPFEGPDQQSEFSS